MVGSPYNLAFAMALTDQSSSSSTSFHLIAYPWDLPIPSRATQRGDFSDTLDLLRGEVGLSGLAVWGAAPAVRHFRMGESPPRLFHAEGGLLFEPVQTRGGCRPVTSMAGQKSLMPAIAHACVQRDLSLRLLLSTSTMGGLAQFYPEFASLNAYDDVSRNSVCLLNPAVQECILGVACDVPPQFGVRQITLVDFRVGWFEAFDEGIGWPSPLGSTEQSILATCFCAACVKFADESGVDVSESRKCVQSLVSKSLSLGTAFGGTPEGFLAEHPSLAELKAIQAERLNVFLKNIIDGCRMEVLIARQDLGQSGGPEQVDWGIPDGVVTTVEDLAQLGELMPVNARRSEVTLPARLLLGSRAEAFIAAMSRLGDFGYSDVQIDNYGALPANALTTLKQAIRFARRSAAL